jgi:lipoprotein signal peptidase
MLKNSFKSHFLYLRVFYKLRHLQVPLGTKMALCAISQVVALAGYQNIVDRFFMARMKDIAHIYVLSINSTIYNFQIVLKTALFVPCLKWKS